jgi:hypothetical protein
MKKVLVGIATALMLISVVHPSFAADKLGLNIEFGTHPYLPDYKFGKSGTLGDVWMLDIEVLDEDGDPAEGAKVRIYNGKKSVGTSTVGSNGIAEVRLMLNKVGVQNFRVVASDSEPMGKGETIFKLEVKQPKILNALTKVLWSRYEDDPKEVYLRPDAELIMDAGCNNTYQYWTSYSNEYLKSGKTDLPSSISEAAATWPFTATKRKGQMYNSNSGYTFAQILKDQITLPYIDENGDLRDTRGDFNEPLGTQILCQNDIGELLILK